MERFAGGAKVEEGGSREVGVDWGADLGGGGEELRLKRENEVYEDFLRTSDGRRRSGD